MFLASLGLETSTFKIITIKTNVIKASLWEAIIVELEQDYAELNKLEFNNNCNKFQYIYTPILY